MKAEKENIFLTIVMPALNEEKNIAAAVNTTLEAFEGFSIDGEIIVINDGSTDGTENLVRELIEKNERLRMIKHDVPRGIGASFWDGVDNASGNFVVMMPGDNENDPLEIFRYCRLLEHVDLVIPFTFNREVRSVFRNFLSFVYRFIINTTFMVNFNYTNGTVLYRKSVLDELDYRSDGFFFQTDILVRTVKKGYLFAEVPYKLKMRGDGASKAVSFPSLIQVVRGYLRLVSNYYFMKDNQVLNGYAKDSLTLTRKKVPDELKR